MTALRTDPTTGGQSLPAPGRAARPADAGGPCPFCPGNEALTPPELARHPAGRAWELRVVPNRYPLVTPPDGRHEVVVESPRHDWDYPSATVAELTGVLWMIRERHRALRGHPAIVTFRNRGPGSGASRAHPHAQTVALRRPPAMQRDMRDRAAAYRSRYGRSLYDALPLGAATDGRIVAEHGCAAAFVPPGPAVDYETWIVPRDAGPDFATAPVSGLESCAHLLRAVTTAYAALAPGAPYHLVLHTAPGGRAGFRWHLRLLPRLTSPAGFEAATGVTVTDVDPHTAATALRARAGPP